MPKLLSVTPCERLIMSKEGSATLINVLVSVNVEGQGEIPADAVAPFNWTVFTMWGRTENEPAGPYRQKFEIVPPGGTSPGQLSAEFEFQAGKRTHQVHHAVNGMPIGQAGFIAVRIWLEEPNGRIIGPIEYPLEITHGPAIPA